MEEDSQRIKDFQKKEEMEDIQDIITIGLDIHPREEIFQNLIMENIQNILMNHFMREDINPEITMIESQTMIKEWVITMIEKIMKEKNTII